MLKKTMMTAAAAVLMFNVNTLTASAYTPMPEVSAKAPVTTPADGSYKVAQRVRRGVCAVTVVAAAAATVAAISGSALLPASLAWVQLLLRPMQPGVTAAATGAGASVLNGAVPAAMAGKPGAGSGVWKIAAAKPPLTM
jgi:hypothetical protein